MTICFKSNPLRWPLFYPVEYKGVVLATAVPENIPGTGSASASVVQAPLTLKIGNMKTFYQFIFLLIIIVILLIIFLLKLMKKLPKKKKKYCKKCKKSFSVKMKFCPECGEKLEI